MLTQCPSCQTVFRVTSTILRAAHGEVRCGRCNTQFDAIEHLLDGEDAQAQDNLNATSSNPQVGTGINHDYEAVELEHEDIVLEGNRIEISGVYQRVDPADTDADAESHATQARTVIEEFNIGTEEWENPFGPDHDTDAEHLDTDETEVEDVEQELSAASLADAINSLDTTPIKGDIDKDGMVGSVEPVASVDNAATPDTRPFPVEPAAVIAAPVAVDASPFDEPFSEAPQPRRWPWLIASTVLSMLLIAQALHHSRETLARHPSFGPLLSKLYAAIGQPLTPQWQLQAYSIKQWGIVSDPQAHGTLRVRASITNGANFAQPYPLLQLRLEDRFGSSVGKREFKPEEYLSSNAQATRLLAAGEATNVDLAIVDPGQDAVGFQFDTCLQLSSGLHCAHELQSQ